MPALLKQEPDLAKPFLLYSGRKERGKNLHLLIEYFSSLPPALKEHLRLVLIGSGDLSDIECSEEVIDLGFVSEEEKRCLMSQALALCQPSTNESFSIVLMEAWLEETPVLVHSSCAVTREHVIESGGGLHFANAKEFSAVVAKLLKEPKLWRALGEHGKEYVQSVYSWKAVRKRFEQALLKLIHQDELEPEIGERASG